MVAYGGRRVAREADVIDGWAFLGMWYVHAGKLWRVVDDPLTIQGSLFRIMEREK
jgi:hypothetical protein